MNRPPGTFGIGDHVTLAGHPGRVANTYGNPASPGAADVRLAGYAVATRHVPVALLAHAPEPLRVGDVLDADSPEPPAGVVIVGREGVAWAHRGSIYAWRPTHMYEPDDWSFITRCQMPATVVHVPRTQPHNERAT